MSMKTDRYADLRKRLVFLLLALVVYRIGAHIPVPGIDPDQLAQLFKSLVALHRICLGHHAVYLCVDHHAADDGSLAPS
jgi:preprotein translocase subunit SecY